MHFESEIDGQTFAITLDREASTAVVNGEEIPFRVIRQENGRILFRTGTNLYKIDMISTEDQHLVFTLNGEQIEAVVRDEQELLLEKLGFASAAQASAGELRAPMPGRVLDILADPGTAVTAGQPLLILEAMKMENELTSTTDGTVDTLHVKKGENVEKNQLLLEISSRG